MFPYLRNSEAIFHGKDLHQSALHKKTRCDLWKQFTDWLWNWVEVEDHNATAKKIPAHLDSSRQDL